MVCLILNMIVYDSWNIKIFCVFLEGLKFFSKMVVLIFVVLLIEGIKYLNWMFCLVDFNKVLEEVFEFFLKVMSMLIDFIEFMIN